MFDQVTMKWHQIFNSYTDTQNVKRSLDMKETAVSISSIPLCIMVTSKSTKYWTVLFQNNREEREPADLKTLTNKQTALLLWMLWNDWHENREGRTLSFKGPLTKYHHSQTSCWMDNIDIFQQTSSIAACHAWAHTSISDFFFFNIQSFFFSVNIPESTLLYHNQWFQFRTNYFCNNNQKTHRNHISFLFFFLLDSKSVTLIFRLYIFRLSPWIYRLLR